MKKALLLAALFLVPSVLLAVDIIPRKTGLTRSEFNDMATEYHISGTSITHSCTASRLDVNFRGYPKSIYFQVIGTTVQWCVSNLTGDTTGTILTGNWLDKDFAIPLSSPSVFTFSLLNNVTFHYYIDGYQTDK